MAKESSQFKAFNTAMDTILRADPIKVKAGLLAQVQATTAEREARGARKRGRKAKVQPSVSGHVSSAKG
jgi:hypothetical protein